MPLIPNRVQNKGFWFRWCLPVLLGMACVMSGIMHEAYVHKMKVYAVYVDAAKIGLTDHPEQIKEALDQKLKQSEASNSSVAWSIDDQRLSIKPEELVHPKLDESAVVNKVVSFLQPYPTGVEIMVDGKAVATVKDKATAESILTEIKSPYEKEKMNKDKVTILSADAKAKVTKTQMESVNFAQDVELKPVSHIEPSKIRQPDDVVRQLKTGGKKKTTYVIKKGDCISCIAHQFHISEKTIYDNNPWLHVDDVLQIGKTLDLTVYDPTLSVITKENVTESLDMAYDVSYQDDPSMPKGKTVVIKPGKDGKKVDTYEITKRNGIQIDEQLIREQILAKPVTEIAKRGTKVVPDLGTGNFAWPVQNPMITSGYGMRWGSFHKGVDIVSRNRNLHIKAADNGTVTYAQFNNGGYGNCVLIDHHNGYVTRYAHMSKILVHVGEVVQKGEIIGIMGETGDADGIHLHFEIHKNGQLENPMKYLNQ